MCVPSRTRCPTLKGCKLRYLVYDRKSCSSSFKSYLSAMENYVLLLNKLVLDYTSFCYRKTLHDFGSYREPPKVLKVAR